MRGQSQTMTAARLPPHSHGPKLSIFLYFCEIQLHPSFGLWLEVSVCAVESKDNQRFQFVLLGVGVWKVLEIEPRTFCMLGTMCYHYAL